MWKLKVLLQFFLAYIPGGEKINYVFQNLRNSHSTENTAKQIINLAEKIKLTIKYVNLENSTVVEIGTGWNAISALLFSFLGTKCCYTFDHLPHVHFRLIQQIINQLEEQIDTIHLITSVPKTTLMKSLKKMKSGSNIKDTFSSSRIIYMAPGDASNTGLADNSVDLVYTYAVLEHISENLINDILIESKRILKTNGIFYCGIGLHDHYAGIDKNISKVNFLRYPEWLWSFFIKNKISYHNRLREKQFIDIFKSHGAKIVWMNNEIDPSDLDVLKTMKIDNRFSGMAHEELATNYSEFILSF